MRGRLCDREDAESPEREFCRRGFVDQQLGQVSVDIAGMDREVPLPIMFDFCKRCCSA